MKLVLEKLFAETYFEIAYLTWLLETKHFPESKNTSQNPKHFPESKTRPRIQKHVPESKTLPRIPKHVPESKTRPRIQNTS